MRDGLVEVSDSALTQLFDVFLFSHIYSRHSTILSMFSNITYTYRHTVRFGYPNITESVLRSHRSQLAVERTVQELLELQGRGILDLVMTGAVCKPVKVLY